jgi:hypothetical protein
MQCMLCTFSFILVRCTHPASYPAPVALLSAARFTQGFRPGPAVDPNSIKHVASRCVSTHRQQEVSRRCSRGSRTVDYLAGRRHRGGADATSRHHACLLWGLEQAPPSTSVPERAHRSQPRPQRTTRRLITVEHRLPPLEPSNATARWLNTTEVFADALPLPAFTRVSVLESKCSNPLSG